MALISTLRISCRSATELMERREFRVLGMRERVGLWFHLRICDGCRAYAHQSEMIDRLLEKRTQTAIDSSALEHRIISELH